MRAVVLFSVGGVAVVAGSIGVEPARASLVGYAVYGGAAVTVGGSTTLTSGYVGSNGSITLGTFGSFAGVTAVRTISDGGSLTFLGPVSSGGSGQFGSDMFAGPVSAGGDLTFSNGPTTVAGGRSNLTAGGSVSTSFAALTGDVRAGRDVNIRGSLDVLNGNVYGNANVVLNGTVNGAVTYGQTITVGSFGKATAGTAQGTTTVTPVTVAAQAIPAVPFPVGAAVAARAITGRMTTGGTLAAPLAPGVYGDTDLGTFTDLYLTAGDYTFASLTLDGSQTIHLLNLTPTSHVTVNVVNDFSQSTFVNTTVNEVPFASANAALATNVLYNVGGTYTQTALGGGSDQTFGTVLDSTGDVLIGNYGQLDGSIIGGGTVNIGTGLAANYVAASFVPEPAAVGLAGAAALLVGRRRRRSKRS